jgi:hypothetical protein
MCRNQILYAILNVVVFSVMLIGARRSGESKLQLSDNSADVRFGTSSLNNAQTQTKRNADQLNTLLFQADFSLVDVFEPNFEGSPEQPEISDRMMKEEQNQDKSVLIVDSQDLSLLDFEPDVRMMTILDGHPEAVEAIGPAIGFEDSCEITLGQEEYFQQQETETLIQEELYQSEESGEVSISVTISEVTTCQTVIVCKPQVHPILGMRCFCRNVLVCETIYG